ncbi:uncharacterized protein LOC109814224 [Cajanus cajan]|uniref:DUF4228 domain-containing protein n=1 Tax=Cajanus cajan TaxID=3821 RepID=A0A151S0E4_CAJCA|nr:uncharacterized protein LOC109814224 [Cajanus cajan]KYP48256.1 hypothetical protein KK1_030040 [Cajanus cajan]
MGNCLRSNKISAQDHGENYETTPSKVEKIIKVPPSSKLEAPRVDQSSIMKKKVRFNIIENDGSYEGGERGSGKGNCRSVRIRVVMTQEELKRMLRCKDEAHHTSLEELLDAVRLRGGRISEVGECGDERMDSWKPSLDSIPEDSLMNLL